MRAIVLDTPEIGEEFDRTQWEDCRFSKFHPMAAVGGDAVVGKSYADDRFQMEAQLNRGMFTN